MGDCFPTFDRCVEWTGPNIPELEIKKGDRLNVVVEKMTTAINSFTKPKYDVSGIGGGVTPVSVEDALTQALKSLNSQDAANVNYVGSTYGLDLGQSSADLYKLQGKSFSAIISPTKSGTSVGLDISEPVSDLPAGYSLDSTRVILTGSRKGGTNVIADTSKQAFATVVDNDRFPLTADVEAVINTPNGVARLRRNFTIATSVPVEEKMYLEASALSQAGAGPISQASFNDSAAAEISALRNRLDQLNNIGIVGASSVELSGASLVSAISAMVGKLDELHSRLNSIETVQISTYSSEGVKLEEATLTEALKKVSEQASTSLEKNVKTDSQVTLVSNKVDALGTGSTSPDASTGLPANTTTTITHTTTTVDGSLT